MISTHRKTVENYRSIDVRCWHRNGLLQPGRAFGWRWAWDDTALNIAAEVRINYVMLSCRFGEHGWSPEYFCRILLDTTPCHFGWDRYWFLCPARGCDQRVAVLYLKGREFACRHCCHLTYQSQREREAMRALRRAQKIRVRLGGSADMQTPFPDKPKGMHGRTYRTLHQKGLEVEARWVAGAEAWLKHFRKG
jgi:hypothetical protein